ncbi:MULTISPECIES: glycosyltransferase family 2 protein [unclassified Bifidobacterium]|uniref:glycosyltransferase family 2 protein n=1 Tax=unclassified Bifidobacterium TaxID=2608897 RepID=UPI001125E908|nr:MULTISPECIES: glycosyltransferase family 2 protein [unclassified Bifidobacterium]
MADMSHVSIIVPVYKVESRLDRCVRSLVAQTYRNIEIILVDDGSPDCCPQICDEWSRRDSRIQVIHQANGGLSAARNAGLDVAHGQYIAFVDSDDWVEPDYIESLLEALSRTNSDVAICSIAHEDNAGNPLPDDKPIADSEEIHSPYDCLRNRLIGYAGVVAWNKLYAARIWSTLRYPVGATHEDEFVIHHVAEQCTRTVWLPQQLYHYIDNVSSIMGAQYNIKRLDRLDAWIDRVITLNDKADCADIIDALFDSVIVDLFYSESLGWNNTEVHARLRKVFAHFRQIPVTVTRMMSKKHALYYWGLRICPFLFWRLKMLLKG